MAVLEFTAQELGSDEVPLRQPKLFTLVIKNCPVDLAGAQDAFETAFISISLRRFAGNVTRTARALGVSRRCLTRKINQLGIDMNAMRSIDMTLLESGSPITVILPVGNTLGSDRDE
ncbi:MAG TPA: helix-turn-helix domain-containing protein [bacterium]|jgi:DNA-binding NtrC family response regulator